VTSEITAETRETPDPYPQKPAPVYTGAGFAGYGYGLAWRTPGLPVLFPTTVTYNHQQPPTHA
jgi:hypothetical protein